MKLPRRLAFGVRPERVIVASGPTNDAPIEAKILWVEHLGNRSIIALRMSEVTLAAVVPPNHPLNTDRRAWVGLRPEPQHLLNRETGVFFQLTS
jgi:ABC-type sugar transport system ATPase subunit